MKGVFMNYYLKNKVVDIFTKEEKIETMHIGTKRLKWKFLFNHNDKEFLKSFIGWKELLLQNKENIVDSSGNKVPYNEFMNMIQESQKCGDAFNPQEYISTNFDMKNFEFLDKDGYRFSSSSVF